jgi:hypothetical protein
MLDFWVHRNHHSVVKYFKRFYPVVYFDTIVNDMGGVIIQDEFNAVWPANLMEHCLHYGSDNDVAYLIRDLERVLFKNNHVNEIFQEYPVKIRYTRSFLRWLLPIMTLMGSDPNDVQYFPKLIPQNNLYARNEFYVLSSDSYIRENIINIIRNHPELAQFAHKAIGDAQPPFSKEQLRAVLNESVDHESLSLILNP